MVNDEDCRSPFSKFLTTFLRPWIIYDCVPAWERRNSVLKISTIGYGTRYQVHAYYILYVFFALNPPPLFHYSS
jgi:hypothetical protein